MSIPQILIAEPAWFPEEGLALLRETGEVRHSPPGRAALLAAVSTAEVLWVRLAHPIDSALMAAAPQLRMIVSATTGLNHIDLEEAHRRGIDILSLRGKTDFLKDVRATAEHTIGLMLALLRHIPAAAADTVSGNWRRDEFRGGELYGKTVGIVGYGRLGKIVARYLAAFEARVLVTDPLLQAGRLQNVESMEPAELLQQSDLITLHVDLREETHGFFDASMFRKMKRGACFVNTARGELIEEQALLQGLEDGSISGAAVDVLSNENSCGMSGHPLIQYARSHGNLIVTPHIGGCTVKSMQKTENFLARELHAILLGQSLGRVLAESVCE